MQIRYQCRKVTIPDCKRYLIKKSTFNIDKPIVEKLKALSSHINTTFDLNYIQNITYNNYKEETYNYNTTEKQKIIREIDATRRGLVSVSEVGFDNNNYANVVTSYGIYGPSKNKRDTREEYWVDLFVDKNNPCPKFVDFEHWRRNGYRLNKKEFEEKC